MPHARAQSADGARVPVAATEQPAVDLVLTTQTPSGLPAGRPGAMSALVALTALLAIELLRAFPTMVTWQLGIHLDLTSRTTAAVFVAPFLGAAVAVVVSARRDPRLVLVVGAVTLGVARMGVQLGDGVVPAVLAGIGLLAALGLLGVFATMGLPLFGGGVVAGALLDSVLHSVFGTRGLVWAGSGWAVAVVALVVVWHLSLVFDRAQRDVFVLGRSVRSSVPLVAVGPVLVVEAFMLANVGWVGERTGLGWLGAATVIGVAGGAGIVAAALTARFPSGMWCWWASGGAVALVGLAAAGSSPGMGWVLLIVAAQIGIGSGLTVGVARGVGTGHKVGPVIALTAGYLLVLGAVTTLDGRGVLGVPLRPSVVLIVSGALLAGSITVSAGERPSRPHRPGRAEFFSLSGVFLVPAAVLVAGLPVALGSSSGVAAMPVSGELRVVTYNVGLAFDAQGRLNLDAVAATLRDLDADVVGLQEVPRGHLPTGGIDMLGWLQRTLDMPHVVFQPSGPDSMHGNAVLSRYPIGNVDLRTFSGSGTALPRGAMGAEVSIPGIDDVVFITAHLPPGGTPEQRAERVQVVLDIWAQRPRTIVAADLNAQPGSDILVGLTDAGLTSAWRNDADGGHTFPSDAPRARIDWVLHSADLSTIDAVVHDSIASDHRPLLAVISLLD